MAAGLVPKNGCPVREFFFLFGRRRPLQEESTFLGVNAARMSWQHFIHMNMNP